MIQLYHVHKRFENGAEALSDVTLRVREGEFVFLTGRSGAGKSTLLRLLLVMERVTEGQILIGGRNIHVLRASSVPYLRRNIGVIFQDFRLIPNRTVWENVAIGMQILGIGRKEIDRRVGQLLEAIGLEQRKMALPCNLSGGEQQRVAIARALVNEPAILLADEPTGNLDPQLSLEIMDLLQEINRRGTTVLVATHDTALIEQYGLRTLELEAGRLLHDHPRREGGAGSRPGAGLGTGAWDLAAKTMAGTAAARATPASERGEGSDVDLTDDAEQRREPLAIKLSSSRTARHRAGEAAPATLLGDSPATTPSDARTDAAGGARSASVDAAKTPNTSADPARDDGADEGGTP